MSQKKKREKKGDSCLRIASGVCAEISNVCSSAANYVDNKKKGGWDGMDELKQYYLDAGGGVICRCWVSGFLGSGFGL